MGKQTVYFADGPLEGETRIVDSELSRVSVFHPETDHLLHYQIHVWGWSMRVNRAWVFPNWGRFVQWTLGDLEWIKKWCRQVDATAVEYRQFHIASLGHMSSAEMRLAAKHVPPVRWITIQKIEVPVGYVLPLYSFVPPPVRQQTVA